jgi:hypothetical protein
MENTCCQYRVGFAFFQYFNQVIEGSGSAGSYDWHGNGFGNGSGQLTVITVFGAVGIHTGQQNFPGAEFDAFFCPFNGVKVDWFAAAMGVDLPFVFSPGNALGVNGKHDALAAETFSAGTDQFRVVYCGRVYRSFIGAVVKHQAHIFDSADSAAYSKRYEYLGSGSADDIYHCSAIVAGSGNIQENYFIGTLFIVFYCGLNGVAGINEIYEIDPFNYPAVSNVKTRNYSFCQH